MLKFCKFKEYICFDPKHHLCQIGFILICLTCQIQILEIYLKYLQESVSDDAHL